MTTQAKNFWLSLVLCLFIGTLAIICSLTFEGSLILITIFTWILFFASVVVTLLSFGAMKRVSPKRGRFSTRRRY